MFIQTEETPNPATLKFLPGKTILEHGTQEFKSKDEAKDHPLASKLLSEENVVGVFVGKEFITITKSPEVEWDILKPSILSIILDFFSSGGEIKQSTTSNNDSEEKLEYSKEDQEIV